MEKLPHKLRKSRKQRGSRYCGWGQVGQHRKGGMRGGKGRAGGRKHYWIRTVKYEPDRFRKVGFKPPSALEPKPETVNVGELGDIALKTFGVEKVRDGGDLTLDLDELGYGKLLGRGEVSMPLTLRVSEYTSKALKKVETAGGQIVGPE